LAIFSAPGEISELGALLSIEDVSEDTASHCMCFGSLTFDFLPSGDSISVHHGESIRWEQAWNWDAPLRDGYALAKWLAAKGQPDLLREMD
ncbi:unnamed protein product, partial [Phaeothamnion confervicola]